VERGIKGVPAKSKISWGKIKGVRLINNLWKREINEV
jgi:hypothetical protein